MYTGFDLTPGKRAELMEYLVADLEDYYSRTSDLRVTPDLDPGMIRSFIRKADLDDPADAKEVVAMVTEGLRKFIVHTPHPRYYGLFNPRAGFPGIIADLITATFNPQLAAWSHSPYASEVENFLIAEFGARIGFPKSSVDGVFATGGAEANITAVLCALTEAFPTFAGKGILDLGGRPLIYCSSESHHSVVRAARTSGLGKESVRMLPVNDRMEIRTDLLEEKIAADRESGHLPFMVIGTAGTTGTGSIDDLDRLADIAKRNGLWYHIDSAWGGAAVVHPGTKAWVKGIERADSVTLDVHKWLSVPMSASMFITGNRDILDRTFRITNEYMPKDAEALDIVDPYTHSIQWSRRFIGLKLYLSLAIFGWKGFAETIWHQVKMGNLLRDELTANGWIIMNNTPLPLVCFTDREGLSDSSYAKRLCEKVVRSGEAWVSVYPVKGVNTIRACITNYNTSPEDIKALVATVNRFRK